MNPTSNRTAPCRRHPPPWLHQLAACAVAAIALVGAASALATPETSRLFGADGKPLASSLQLTPADPAHRTRLGLYATPEQYEWEALTIMHLSVLLDLDRIGSIAEAIARAQGIRALHATPKDVAYLVKSSDRAQAARLVDRLADDGFRQVFVIEPAPH